MTVPIMPNRFLALLLLWGIVGIGCSPTSNDMRVALDRSKVQTVEKRGDTALHVAAAKGDSSAVSNLIRQGTDVNAVNHNGQTPLILAILQEQPAVARMLIEQGAKTHLADEWGNTALHLATLAGQVDTVKALLARGVDPNIPNKAKDTPLLVSIKLDYPNITMELLGKQARVDTIDAYGLTPLHYAVNWRHIDLAQELMRRGISPDVKASDGLTPLMVAAYFGDLQTATALLDNRASVDLTDHEKRTSLHLAAQNGHENVAALLLDHGADINAITSSGETAAQIATHHDQRDMMLYLVKRGAKFIPLDKTSHTTFASALIAQAISDEALKQHDLPKAREHVKLATEWFEKAALAYQDAADSADMKIFFVNMGWCIPGGVAIVILCVLSDTFPKASLFDNAVARMNHQLKMQALATDKTLGTGHWGYFSKITRYEKAFQGRGKAIPYISEREPMLATQQIEAKPDPSFHLVRELYRNAAQQARDASVQSHRRLECLGQSAHVREAARC